MDVVWLGIGFLLAGLAATAPLRWAMAIVFTCLPFGGTQVFNTGGDPILLPVVVSLGFLARHAISMFSRPLRLQFFLLMRTELPILAFLAYALVSGLFFPRLFAGAVDVVPQSSAPPTPLDPSMISFPQLAYLSVAVYLYLALRQALLRVGIIWALYALLLQISFIGGIGFLQGVLAQVNVRLDMTWIVNAQGYGLAFDQIVNGFGRVSAVFPEASSFASWGAGALPFCYALYLNPLNRVLSNLAFGLLVILGIAMLLSTSSTAYGAIAIIAAFACVHALLDSDAQRRERGLVIIIAGGLLFAILTILAFSSDAGFLGRLRGIIETMTVSKATSESGLQRGEWAARSLQNGWDTALLGVGYGAARSSGIFHSLFGLVGAPGLLLFLAVVTPPILRAFKRPHTGEEAVASAASFGLFGSLAAMALVAPDLSLANAFWAFLPLAAAPLAERATLLAMVDQGANAVRRTSPV